MPCFAIESTETLRSLRPFLRVSQALRALPGGILWMSSHLRACEVRVQDNLAAARKGGEDSGSAIALLRSIRLSIRPGNCQLFMFPGDPRSTSISGTVDRGERTRLKPVQSARGIPGTGLDLVVRGTAAFEGTGFHGSRAEQEWQIQLLCESATAFNLSRGKARHTEAPCPMERISRCPD